jgi:hypothetical protein
MTVNATAPAVLVLSRSWRKRETELSFVTRAVAGAASRSGDVEVITPMPSGTIEADGAFDLLGIGEGRGGEWPDIRETRWIRRPDRRSIWVLDEPSEGARALFRTFADQSTAYSIKPVARDAATMMMRQLLFTPGLTTGSSEALGMYVPINPLAARHRHAGLGFTGYVLVLTDRHSTPPVTPPTAAVAWLTSRFHRQYVVVIEGGSAAVWRGRALRGIVGVDTRMDLWRLMAHANVTVDLAPGDIIARECIESLRFGTPIVVPNASTGAAHAHAGGGVTFSDIPELLERVEQLGDQPERGRFSRQGVDYASSTYGDPSAFVSRISRALDQIP